MTLLSDENLSYASTCQTIGLNTGYFASFTVFLALNSEAFRYVSVIIGLCQAFCFIDPLARTQQEMGRTAAISQHLPSFLECHLLFRHRLAHVLPKRGRNLPSPSLFN